MSLLNKLNRIRLQPPSTIYVGGSCAKATMFALLAAVACVDNNINVQRRACAFGSYQLFLLHVESAMETLGCDTGCNGCSLSSLTDCDDIAIIAAYAEEAGDSNLEKLHLASADCLIPGGFSASPASDIVAAIKKIPEMPCAGNEDIEDESWALFTAYAGFSTFLLIQTMSAPAHSYSLL